MVAARAPTATAKLGLAGVVGRAAVGAWSSRRRGAASGDTVRHPAATATARREVVVLLYTVLTATVLLTHRGSLPEDAACEAYADEARDRDPSRRRRLSPSRRGESHHTHRRRCSRSSGDANHHRALCFSCRPLLSWSLVSDALPRRSGRRPTTPPAACRARSSTRAPAHCSSGSAPRRRPRAALRNAPRLRPRRRRRSPSAAEKSSSRRTTAARRVQQRSPAVERATHTQPRAKSALPITNDPFKRWHLSHDVCQLLERSAARSHGSRSLSHARARSCLLRCFLVRRLFSVQAAKATDAALPVPPDGHAPKDAEQLLHAFGLLPE